MTVHVRTCEALIDAFSLWHRAGKQLIGNLYAEWGVNFGPTGIALLGLLDRDGELRVGAVAEELQLDPSVISRLVSDLEADNLITRRPDESDRRVALIALTDRGRELIAQLKRLRCEWIREALRDWSDADARTLFQLMIRLNDDIAAVRA